MSRRRHELTDFERSIIELLCRASLAVFRGPMIARC